MTDVLVLGSGLIGTSVALALAQSSEHTVLLHDQDPSVRDVALARGAGRARDGRRRVDIALVAVPPAATAAVLCRAQALGIAQTYTHVSSVQSQVQREVEVLNCDLSSVVGGHPLAGRESSGPGAAAADLFVGRPWAVCPSTASGRAATAAVTALATACGATPLIVDAEEHDRAVALLSHLPQVASSALAALLTSQGAQPDSAPPVSTALSGTGLADTTRLAAGDAALWTQILAANAAHVAPAVRALAALLEDLALHLDAVAGVAADVGGGPVAADSDGAGASRAITAFLQRGNRGRALLPVKRGDRDEVFGRVVVEVDDRPGRLAALLTDAGAAGVNVEDVRVDHVPGRPRGVIELLVHADVVSALTQALQGSGWAVVE